MPPPPNPGFASSQGMAAPPSFGQQMQGLNSKITPFTSSLRDITRNFAAGFAKDPAVREQYSAQNAVRDESKRREQVAMRQQQIEQLVNNFESYAQAIQGSGGQVTPSIQKLLDQNVQLLGQVGFDPAEAQMLADQAIAIGSLPQAGESFTLGEGQARYGPNGEIIAQGPSPGPESTIGKLSADLAAGNISQQEYDIAIKAMQPVGTNVTIKNEGPIPPGYAVIRDKNGQPIQLVPIAGGPAAAEVAGAEAATEMAKANAEFAAGNVLGAVGSIRKELKAAILPTTGYLGAKLSNVGGTAAANIKASIDTIKANISLEKLNSMRKESKTGGALGNVSEGELTLLGNTIANLEQSQDANQFNNNLDIVEQTFDRIVNGTGKAAPKKDQGTVQKWKIENGTLVPE